MVTVLKAVGGPGSTGFLACCCIVGLVLIFVWPKKRTLGRAWLLSVFAGYIVLGTPALANGIAESLAAIAEVTVEPVAWDKADAPGPAALFVLGGDNSRGRVAEALRAYRVWKPQVVIVSGEDWLAQRLIEGGVPWTRMLHELESTNTGEQMQALRTYLADRPGTSVAIVASRLQMPRVAAFARAMHLQVTLVPSPADVEPPHAGVGRWIPRYSGLRISRDAIYEYAALMYYRDRGWAQ